MNQFFLTLGMRQVESAMEDEGPVTWQMQSKYVQMQQEKIANFQQNLSYHIQKVKDFKKLRQRLKEIEY